MVSSVSGSLPAIKSALDVAVLVVFWGLICRESMQPAISGFFGSWYVLIVYIVRESKGDFLLGIWMSLLRVVVFAVSILNLLAPGRLPLELGQ